MNSYSDIINLSHHVSKKHPQMSMHDRAAQFAPFAALTGYEDAVNETARITECRKILDSQEIAELNRRMSILKNNFEQCPEIKITYFVADKLKSGGQYITFAGTVSRINETEKYFEFSDGKKIYADDIISISGKIFERIP